MMSCCCGTVVIFYFIINIIIGENGEVIDDELLLLWHSCDLLLIFSFYLACIAGSARIGSVVVVARL